MAKKIYEMLLGTRARALVTGALLFSAVSGADYYLRNEISVDIFYFLPIFVLTWRGSRGWGLAAAAAGVLVWITDEPLPAGLPGPVQRRALERRGPAVLLFAAGAAAQRTQGDNHPGAGRLQIEIRHDPHRQP